MPSAMTYDDKSLLVGRAYAVLQMLCPHYVQWIIDVVRQYVVPEAEIQPCQHRPQENQRGYHQCGAYRGHLDRIGAATSYGGLACSLQLLTALGKCYLGLAQ